MTGSAMCGGFGGQPTIPTASRAKAGTLAKILGIVPTWMAGISVGCAIGCGLFG